MAATLPWIFTREKEEEYWTPGAVISLEKFCARRKEKNQLEACFYTVALKLEINSIVFKLCTKEGINFFFFHKMKWVSIFREWNSHTSKVSQFSSASYIFSGRWYNWSQTRTLDVENHGNPAFSTEGKYKYPVLIFQSKEGKLFVKLQDCSYE